jgi:hypothetical protein
VVTFDILSRVFCLRHGRILGTCFAIDVESTQWIVTAAHLVRGIKDGEMMDLYHERCWKNVGVRTVKLADPPTDVAVMTLDQTLPVVGEVCPTLSGFGLGQDAYFLGFPYGVKCEVGKLNLGFPVPFVKKGTLSSLGLGKGTAGEFFLDGFNNPGFSGGPVVFTPGAGLFRRASGWSPAVQIRVAGVVSSYRYSPEPIYRDEEKTDLSYRANTGIVICFTILKALDLIKAKSAQGPR